MKTIIPWMGGKSRLAKSILPYFPDHTCYVEPFAGSAALFFAKEPAKCEVLNDLDGELMNLYRVVQNHLDSFLDCFQWMVSSREYFERLREADIAQLTDIQRASRFFYIQKHAFGANGSSKHFGTATTSPPKFNVENIVKTLQDAHERLKRTYIEHLPWSDIVERYDRPHTLFYCDPPYWETAGYGVPFEWAQYQALRKSMDNISGKMLISINDHPEIRTLFDGLAMIPLKTTYTVGGNKKKAKELLIFNKSADAIVQQKVKLTA